MKNKKNFFFSKIFQVMQKLSISRIDGSQKRYPKVLQLPITYNCNSRCVMCNIWQMDHSKEMDIKEFSEFLKDPIFKEVRAVGINGGEPSLVTNLPDFAAEILKLPSLVSLNLISHGFSKTPLLKSLKIIYKMCKEKGIPFHVSISLDGVGSIHDIVRGKPKTFEKTISTINEIMQNKSSYCDSTDVGCTIVKQNIDYLIELDMYAKAKKFDIKYRLGIDNKRIESDRLRDSYSVIYSPLKQSAQEFFHARYWNAKGLRDKFKYFSIYYWLVIEKKRLLGCAWKDNGITMDARGELFYCAVASDRIGSLREDNGEKVFFDENNINYRKSIIKNDCNNCIHDYNGRLEIKNILIFIKYFIFEKIWTRIYLLKSKFIYIK